MSEEKKPLNFLEQIIEEDLSKGMDRNKLRFRFPPEPNGYLHIGHTKAIGISFGLGEKYDAPVNLRFDDTNPTKEEQEYVDAIKRDDGTIILRVNNTILFNPDDARISPQSLPTLRKIADMIRPLPMTLRIEGHTDDRVTTAPGLDNWDLSIARAVSVTRFYDQGSLLPLDRMSAIGYGSQRPLVPNTTEENRSQNRRVDFVLRVKDTSGTSPASNEAGKIPL